MSKAEKLRLTKAKKRFGQNFLIDENVVLSLVKAADISPKNIVIEAGAGTGAVTAELAKLAKKVIAVEIDRGLIPKLRKSVKEFNNVEVVNEDILKIFPENPPKADNGAGNFSPKGRPAFGWKFTIFPEKYKIVGSIPYQITSPLIHRLFLTDNRPQTITLIVQYEVAKKICAEAPNATYLSNFISLFGEAKLVQKVKKQSFYPQPSVESAIIHINRKNSIPKPEEFTKWSKFLHRGFSHPRKMLKAMFNKSILIKFGVKPTARAQELSFDSWISIFNNETI